MPLRHGDNILRGFNLPTVTCTFCARGTVLFLGLADLSPMIFYSAFLLNNV